MGLSKNTNQSLNNPDHRSQITDYYLIRYAEIALKGRNRRWFEQKLINNLKKNLPGSQVEHLHSQLLLKITTHSQNKVRNLTLPKVSVTQPILAPLTSHLSKVFGIAWFAPVTLSPLNLEDLTQQTISLIRSQITPKGSRLPQVISGTDHRSLFTFAVRVTRHDKSYPLTSRQLETHLGSAILSHFIRGRSPKINSPDQKFPRRPGLNSNKSQNMKSAFGGDEVTVAEEKFLDRRVETPIPLAVNLSNPDLTLYIEILKDRALLYTKKIPGPGGLPVGTAGKALCLLSGGFDSVAAAYLMAKRGLQVDFLHFHIFDDPKQLQQTKIWTIAQFLSPIVHAKTLYTVACSPFQSKLKQLDKKYRSQKLILSRRFMIRTALQLAYQHGYQAIITGDSLGQVASQTLSNLSAVDEVLQENDNPQHTSGQTSKTTPTTNSPNNSNQITDYRLPIPLFRPLIGFDKRDIIDLVKQIGLYDEVIKPYQDCCSLAATHPATHANLATIHQLENQLSLPSLHPQISSIYIGS